MEKFKNTPYVIGNTALDLQLFADANMNTTGSTGMSNEMKTFYDKALIRLASPNLVHDQFGQKRPIPKNGGKTIEFRKYDSLGKALTPLTEGVTPDGQSMNVTNVLATIEQYGKYVTITDMLSLSAIDNNIVEATRLIADQASSTIDTVVRNILNTGTNVIYGGSKTSRTALTATDVLTPDMVFKAVAQLRAQNAPTIDGKYVAIIHPYVAYDFMRDVAKEWIDVNKYSNATAIYNGEIGEYGGVRFVVTSEAKIWNGGAPLSYELSKDTSVVAGKTYYQKGSGDNYTAVASPTGNPSTSSYYEAVQSAVFSTLFIGRDAYGSTEITGGGLQHIVKQLGEGDDPLNQRATVGWKATKTAEILVQQYMVRAETGSAYSATAKAN